MYKSLASCAAAAMLAAFAATGPTAAADQSQATGINKQQNAGEEFSSQRRVRRNRVIVRRGGYYGPRRYWAPGPYAYGAYPYGYAQPYSYRYYRPGPAISFGVGPFGFGVW